MKKIAILGSTGSIGTQALEVISQHKDLFKVEILTAKNNYKLLIEQAIKFKPSTVVITNPAYYKKLKETLKPANINVLAGKDALSEVASNNNADIVLTAMVGFSGLQPTINSIKSNKKIALANKETLVVAGKIIMNLAKQYSVDIIPVDSEHSAIFQCIEGEKHNKIEKLILTASGGPFRGMSYEQLKNKTKEDALKHPNWNMGAKITIDSASLMNKGLEVIEAHWLFGVSAKDIEVIIHPQSIIHSFVRFEDGSIKAQLGLPDMKLPILYALSYPKRIKTNLPRFDFTDYPKLTFEKPDFDVFKNLAFSYYALEKGGNTPCVLNAANEVAVKAFLSDKIKFTQIFDIIEKTLFKVKFIKEPSLNDLFETDEEARKIAQNFV